MVTTENSMQKVYANFKDLVLNFLAQVPTGDEGNKHPFFDLSGYEYSNQQTPKLDGLVSVFGVLYFSLSSNLRIFIR